MKGARRRGPGPSHLSMTPDHAGSVVGVDPHKRTLTATVADARGGILASAHFRVSGEGHRELEAWARQFGQIARWGIEGSASWGRHTAVFLVGRGHDVRDVCAGTGRPGLIARVSAGSQTCWIPSGSPVRCSLTRCCPRRSSAPAGAGPGRAAPAAALRGTASGPVVNSHHLLGQHLVNEAEYLLCELPLELSELPDTKAVKPRLAALERRNRRRRYDAPTKLRLQLLDGYRTQIKALDLEEKQVVAQLEELVDRSGSTLGEPLRPKHPVGRRTPSRSWRRAPVHRGRVRTLQRLSAAARLHRRGARRADPPPLQPRREPACERGPAPDGGHPAMPRTARPALSTPTRARADTKKEARRVLKRHLSNVIYRRMIRDLHAQLPDQPLLAA